MGAIQAQAREDINSFLTREIQRESGGSDIEGMWISAAELLEAETGRQKALVVASDLRPYGYQPTFPISTVLAA